MGVSNVFAISLAQNNKIQNEMFNSINCFRLKIANHVHIIMNDRKVIDWNDHFQDHTLPHG